MKNFRIKDLLITIASNDNMHSEDYFEVNNGCGGPSSPTNPCLGPSSPTNPCMGPSSPTNPCLGPSSPTNPCLGPSSPTNPLSEEFIGVTATAALINLKKKLAEMQAKKDAEKAA